MLSDNIMLGINQKRMLHKMFSDTMQYGWFFTQFEEYAHRKYPNKAGNAILLPHTHRYHI
jgi:hypothetical protein